MMRLSRLRAFLGTHPKGLAFTASRPYVPAVIAAEGLHKMHLLPWWVKFSWQDYRLVRDHATICALWLSAGCTKFV